MATDSVELVRIQTNVSVFVLSFQGIEWSSYAKNCKVCVRYKVLTMCQDGQLNRPLAVLIHLLISGSSVRNQYATYNLGHCCCSNVDFY